MLIGSTIGVDAWINFRFLEETTSMPENYVELYSISFNVFTVAAVAVAGIIFFL